MRVNTPTNTRTYLSIHTSECMQATTYTHTHTHTPPPFLSLLLESVSTNRSRVVCFRKVYLKFSEIRRKISCCISVAIFSMPLCIYSFPLLLPSFRNSEGIDRFQKFGEKSVSEYRVAIDLMSFYVYTLFQR